MTQEEKQLLLKDLSARLQYGIIMTNKVLTETYYPLDGNEWQQAYYDNDWDDVPYLRPMPSMTNEECLELSMLTNDGFKFYLYTNEPIIMCSGKDYNYLNGLSILDWLNEHHFDYRGLIEKGLAIEAPKDMYNYG